MPTITAKPEAKLYLQVYTALVDSFPWLGSVEALELRNKTARRGAEYVAIYRACHDCDFQTAYGAFCRKFELET